MNCVGNKIVLRGRNLLDGKPVDLATFADKVVVIHYWSATSEPCKQDIEMLNNLKKKYQQLQLLGVNLDLDAKAAATYLKSGKANWIHLHETGGLDSRLAEEFMAAYKREGTAMTTRENVHRMADANKAFAHFAW